MTDNNPGWMKPLKSKTPSEPKEMLLSRPTEPLTLLTKLNSTDLMENSTLLKTTEMNSRDKFKDSTMN